MNHGELKMVGAWHDGTEWRYDYRVFACPEDCGYRVRVKWDNKENRPIFEDGQKLPYRRISWEYEVQEAVDAGITGNELADIARRYSHAHSWQWPPDGPLKIMGITLEQ